MTRVIVDAETRRKLHDLTEAMQFTDESGKILGHYTPVANDSRRQPQIGEEEIQQRLRQGGGRTLAEIMVDLEKR
jgi:ribosomal protein S16